MRIKPLRNRGRGHLLSYKASSPNLLTPSTQPRNISSLAYRPLSVYFHCFSKRNPSHASRHHSLRSIYLLHLHFIHLHRTSLINCTAIEPHFTAVLLLHHHHHFVSPCHHVSGIYFPSVLGIIYPCFHSFRQEVLFTQMQASVINISVSPIPFPITYNK